MSGQSASRLILRAPRGTPAPFISATVMGEYVSAKLVVKKMLRGPSYTLRP